MDNRQEDPKSGRINKVSWKNYILNPKGIIVINNNSSNNISVVMNFPKESNTRIVDLKANNYDKTGCFIH